MTINQLTLLTYFINLTSSLASRKNIFFKMSMLTRSKALQQKVQKDKQNETEDKKKSQSN